LPTGIKGPFSTSDGTGRTHMTCGKAFGEQLYDVYLYFQRMIDVQSILC
jgi:hypothetical protein